MTGLWARLDQSGVYPAELKSYATEGWVALPDGTTVEVAVGLMLAGGTWVARPAIAAPSQSDGHDDAFTSMRLRAGFAPSTLVVITTNGTALMCRDLRPFAAYRDGPCILGEDGSVAMYVTDRHLPDATEWEEMDVYTKGRGAQITYVPASQIAQIRVHQSD